MTVNWLRAAQYRCFQTCAGRGAGRGAGRFLLVFWKAGHRNESKARNIMEGKKTYHQKDCTPQVPKGSTERQLFPRACTHHASVLQANMLHLNVLFGFPRDSAIGPMNPISVQLPVSLQGRAGRREKQGSRATFSASIRCIVTSSSLLSSPS